MNDVLSCFAKRIFLFGTAAVLSLAIIAPTQLSAQDEEEVYTLSEYEVDTSKDVGYKAIDVISGSRTAVALTDIAIPIQAITEDLMSDMMSADLDDIVEYAANVRVAYAERDQGWYNIRGFPTDQVYRNGITISGYHEAANLARVEVIKGPRSVTYGSMTPGGSINLITKQPQWTRSGSFTGTIGNYSYRRAVLDVTGPLDAIGDRLAYRFTGAFTYNHSDELFEQLEIVFTYGAVQWRLTDKATIQFEWERHDRDWTPSQGLPFWVSDEFGNQYPWRAYGGGRQNTAWRGPDDWFDNTHDFNVIKFDYSFSENINYRYVVMNRQRERDVFLRQPRGLIRGGEFDGFQEIGTRFTVEEEDHTHHRHDLQIKTSFWNMDHNIVIGFDSRRRTSKFVSQFGYLTDNVVPYDPANPFTNYAGADGDEERVIGWPKGDAPSKSQTLDRLHNVGGGFGFDAWFITDQITAMDGRLHLLWGARTDKIQNPVVQDSTFQGGVVYDIWPGFGAFFSWSESLADNGTGQDANALDPQIGSGTELGLKFYIFDGRLSGSMSYFSIDRSNIPRQVTIFDPITGNRAGERTFLSGLENSSGFDGDIVYSPWDNWQNFFSFSFLNTELVSDETNPAREGGQLGGAPGTQLSVISRYNFSDGPLEGFAVGMGVTYMQEVDRSGFTNLPDVPRGRYSDEMYVTNLFCRYNIDYKDYDLTLMFNIHNLFDIDAVERNQSFLEARTFKGGVRIGF